jgi:hypothetical protein
VQRLPREDAEREGPVAIAGEDTLPGLDGSFDYEEREGWGEGQTSSLTERWFTHPEIVKLVHELYDGPPDLDPMSCAEANEVVQAREYYTAEQDGLTRPWYGRLLWNPPWGGSDASSVKRRGLKKLLTAYDAGLVSECVCVLNANAITTAWFADLLAFTICVPSRRIPHWGPGGKGGSPNSGTIIIYVGDDPDKFSEIFSKLGTILEARIW